MKKVVALLLSLALLCALLAGCKSDGGETIQTTTTTTRTTTAATTTTQGDTNEMYEIQTEYGTLVGQRNWLTDTKETFSFVTVNSGSRNYNNDQIFWKDMEERLNVRFEITAYPQSSWDERVNLLFAGGNYPEIISHVDANTSKKLAQERIFIPLNDLVDSHAPNLKEQLYKKPGAIEEITDDDGNFFIVPGTYTLDISFGLYIREDKLKETGMGIPQTTEQLHNSLKALKEKYPDSIPFGWRFGTNFALISFEAIFRTRAGYHLDPDNNELVFGPATDKYKMMLDYVSRLYQDGLIDIEFSTINPEQLLQKVMDNKVLSTFDYYAPVKEWEMNMRQTDPNVEWTWFLNPKHENITPMVYRNPSFTPTGWSFTNNNHNPEVAIKVFDYYWSPDGIMITNYGWEGITYDTIDGEPEFKDFMQTVDNPNGKTMFVDFGINWNFLWGDKYTVDTTGTVYYEASKAYADAGYESISWVTINFNNDEIAAKADKETAIADATAQHIEKFIRGELSVERDWDSFINTLNRFGLQDVLEIYKTAYERKYN